MMQKKFGRLTVTQRLPNDKYGNAFWECVCDCGNTCSASGQSLRNGHKRSCGCMQREAASSIARTHGMSRSQIYKNWAAMHQRCRNPNSSEYYCYGGRGISICEEWNDFSRFFEWSMKNGWRPGLTIDRIDNDKGYSPVNCRFATRAEQNQNTSRTHRIKDGDRLITAAEAARIVGVSRSTVAKWCRAGRVKTMFDVIRLEEGIDNPMHPRPLIVQPVNESRRSNA